MTTIAYKDGVMAADSQTDWFYRETVDIKIQKKHGVMVGSCGNTGDGKKFRDWILNKGDKPELKDKFSALVVRNGRVTQYDSCLVPMRSEKYTAIGSGAAFAIAAMDCGKNAIEAVRIAKRRDISTGGRIRTIKTK